MTTMRTRPTILIALLTLAVLATEALAQSRSFYNRSGKSVGRSVTDSSGTTTYYDASGKITGRSSTSGNTTTNYDRSGRVISRETTTGNTTSTPARQRARGAERPSSQ